jgi:hypothetical protein
MTDDNKAKCFVCGNSRFRIGHRPARPAISWFGMTFRRARPAVLTAACTMCDAINEWTAGTVTVYDREITVR